MACPAKICCADVGHTQIWNKKTACKRHRYMQECVCHFLALWRDWGAKEERLEFRTSSGHQQNKSLTSGRPKSTPTQLFATSRFCYCWIEMWSGSISDGIQIDKSMFVDWNLRNCQKKGTMHKMQKMQKMQKKQSEETIKGSQSRLKCQHWLGFHAAASAFPTVFEFLHRILVRNFVAHFFFWIQ